MEQVIRMEEAGRKGGREFANMQPDVVSRQTDSK